MGCSFVALNVATLEGIPDDSCWDYTLSPDKRLPRSKSKFCETTLTIDRARYGGEDKEGVQ